MITLTGSAISNQSIYNSMCPKKGGRAITYMNGKGKDKKKQYLKEVLEQYKGKLHTEEMGLEILFFFGTRHKRDCDNYCKLVLDALEGIVYVDDVLAKPLVLDKFYDKENPRVEIRSIKKYKVEYSNDI